MKIYAAAIYTNDFGLDGRNYELLTEQEKQDIAQLAHILESYHYIKAQKYVDAIRRDSRTVFLDSGAFSAYTQGATIPIEDYCDYIRKNIDIVKTDDDVLLASVLDAIGDPLKTFQNQKRMEQLGVCPLPCFHYGEDERYLEYYIQNYGYITLGGMVPVPNRILKYWLDRLWDRYLTDSSGRPRLRVHGFGVTSFELLERYPWYSVDSSSWVQVARTGGLTIFEDRMRVLRISSNNVAVKIPDAHMSTVADVYKQHYTGIIEANGYEVERLEQYYWSRWAYNLQAVNKMNKELANKKITFEPLQKGLF